MNDDFQKQMVGLVTRITALEYLTQEALFMIASTYGDPPGVVKEYRTRIFEQLSSATAPGFDPATSDFLMQELRDAVDRLLSQMEQRMAQKK